MALNQLTRRGLVSSWDIGNKLSYSGSGTGIIDLKSTNTANTTNSPTFSTNNWGYFSLNGSTQDIQTSSQISLGSGNFSLGVLFKSPGASNANNKGIFCFYGSPGSQLVNIYVFSTGVIKLIARDNSANEIALSTIINTYNTDGLWHSVFITRNGTSMSLYVDGAFVTSGTNASFGSISARTGFMGSVSSLNPAQYFSGNIGAACYYNIDLTAQEILINHQYLIKRTLH